MRTLLWTLIQLLLFSSSLMALVVEDIAISHDKQKAAFIFNDDTVNIYELKDGSILAHHSLPEGMILNKIFFSTDDKKINLYTDEGAFAWNTDDGKRVEPTSIEVLHQEWMNQKHLSSFQNIKRVMSYDSVVYNNKEHTIWTAKNETIWIWDKEGKDEIASIVFKDLAIDKIYYIAISENGNYIALDVKMKNEENRVIILDGTSYKIIQSIKAQSGFVYGLDFIDNTHLLLHSQYPIEVWDLSTKKRTLNLTSSGDDKNSLISIYQKSIKPYKPIKSVFGLDVDKDGNIALTGTGDTLRSVLLDKQGKLTQTYQNIYSRGFDARFSPDGSQVAFVYKGEHLVIYETKSAKVVLNMDLGGVPDSSRIVKFSQDGRYVAVGSDGNTVSIVNISQKKLSKVVKLPAGVFSLAWINHSEILAGTKTGLFLIDWQKDTQRSILTESTTALDTHKENNKLSIAVGTEEDGVYILNQDYKVVHTLLHKGVGRINYGEDGKYLVSASNESVMVWDRKDYKKQCSFTNSEDVSIWAMAYNSRKHLIYIGDDNGEVKILDEACQKRN